MIIILFGERMIKRQQSHSVMVPSITILKNLMLSLSAEYLFNQGFSNVTIIDVAISPIHNLKTRVPSFPDKHLIHGDFFEHSGKYDLILEQTFFCAIDPSLRPDYVAKVKELLSDKGKLVGLLFNRTFENNPPYGGDQKSYQSLFSQHFGDIYMEPCYNSIPARSGSELFISIS